MLDLREISRTCVMFSLCAVAGCALQSEAQFVGWGGLGWEDERERSWEVCSSLASEAEKENCRCLQSCSGGWRRDNSIFLNYANALKWLFDIFSCLKKRSFSHFTLFSSTGFFLQMLSSLFLSLSHPHTHTQACKGTT